MVRRQRQRNRFFSSETARDEFIAQFKHTAERADPSLPTLAPHQLIRLQQAVAIAPEADPVEVFRFWAARQALAELKLELGDRNLRDLSTEAIRDYLLNLPFQPRTIKNKRIYLLASFGWWLKQGWLDTNPILAIEVPQVHQKEPGILTVAETRALFRANEKIDPEICGLLALGAFAGMRSSAIARIDYAEIDFTAS